MYHHGPVEGRGQLSRVALSTDGIHFSVREEILGNAYLRVFRWGGMHYALGMPGVFSRSVDGVAGFERGPTLFSLNMRQAGVVLRGDVLYVFYSNAHDCPERILLAQVALTDDWSTWRESEPTLVLEPETPYEGADQPLEPSARGPITRPVRQLRDPAIYEEDGRTYLLYSVAGESGIAIAELVGFPPV